MAPALGWIGLGRMGAPMAERLLRAGARIAGYNRTRAKTAALAHAGMPIVDRPIDLAGCEVVFTMVSTAADLFEVTFGPTGVLADPTRAPRILVDLSTIAEDDSARLRVRAAARGCELLVVPVSGNDVVARAGRLGVLASGARTAFDTVAPWLAVFGPSVRYIGGAEAARTAKICHNLLLAITYQALAEVALVGEQRGLPRHVLMEVINSSVLGSTYSRYKTPAIVNLDHSVTFTLELLRKDLELAGFELDLPLTAATRAQVEATIARHGASADYTTMILTQAERVGLEMRSEDVAIDDGLGA